MLKKCPICDQTAHAISYPAATSHICDQSVRAPLKEALAVIDHALRVAQEARMSEGGERPSTTAKTTYDAQRAKAPPPFEEDAVEEERRI